VEPRSQRLARQRLEAAALWERRCRGYDLFPAPVALEPEFVPFSPFYSAEDGGWAQVTPSLHHDAPLAFARLIVPVEQKVTPAVMGAWLASLSGLWHPLSLEILWNGREIVYGLTTGQGELNRVLASLRGAFPLLKIESGFESKHDFLHMALSGLRSEQGSGSEETATFHYRVVDFGLSDPVFYPLPIAASLSPDPHLGLISILGTLNAPEVAGVQLIALPCQDQWASSLRELANLWPATRALHQGVTHKCASPLWAVSVRVFAAVRFEGRPDTTRALEICQQIGFSLPGGGRLPQRGTTGWGGTTVGGSTGAGNDNSLMALDNTALDGETLGGREHLLDVLARRSRRPGFLASAQELMQLWHLPSETLLHPLLRRAPVVTLALPTELQRLEGIALGAMHSTAMHSTAMHSTAMHSTRHDAHSAVSTPLDSDHRPGSDSTVPIVRWPDAWRTRHFYTLGATRMGKSTLLLNMMAQDMEMGRGLCLIDPHGDLARDVLERVPPGRESNVLFLDLSDADFPPAIGLLDAGSEWEERLLVSDLLSILRRLFSSSWGNRLEHLLRHALLTLVADRGTDQGSVHTLRDLRPLLGDESYRAQVLERVRDPDLRVFWTREFPAYTASALSPLYNKLGMLFASPLVRRITGGRAAKLHFETLIRERRILLIDLSSAKIGSDNAHFLGALLVSKLQLAAMRSLHLSREERTPFTLYVDEFQNFVVSSFETILSEAGKAGLEMVMANQFLEQLSPALQTAILSNVGTLLSFRVSASTGRVLEKEFGAIVEAETLVNLKRGQGVARLGRSGNTIRIDTFAPPTPLWPERDPSREVMTRVVAATRQQLCRPRAEVDAELFNDGGWQGSDTEGEATDGNAEQATILGANAAKRRATGQARAKSPRKIADKNAPS
jgi:hypothetical protein